MKKLTLTSLLLSVAISLSSCSKDESPIDSTTQTSLYEKVIVQRDASGSYSLDYKLNDGADAEIALDESQNMNDIYLYPTTSDVEKRLFKDLSLNGRDNFKVGINNTVTNNKSVITVFDEDIRFSKTTKEDHLEKYKMTDNADGTYTLDFTVKDNISVEFVQQNDNQFEIHLNPTTGKVSDKDFSRTFENDQKGSLKVTFINYFYQESGRTTTVTKYRKPRVSVDQ